MLDAEQVPSNSLFKYPALVSLSHVLSLQQCHPSKGHSEATRWVEYFQGSYQQSETILVHAFLWLNLCVLRAALCNALNFTPVVLY